MRIGWLGALAAAGLGPLLAGGACGGEAGGACRGSGVSVEPTASGSVPVRLETVASGLDFPIYLTSPPADGRLFVVEKGGLIRLVKNGAVLQIPFLDIRSKVSTGSEQGLLGLAFHPEYAGNGRFFVNYTNADGDTRVSAFQVQSDPDVADPASESPVLAVDQPAGNHNGGHLAFGPDRFLYIGLGDGGGGNDTFRNGQNPGTLLGKMLRIDVSGASGYAVPPDNPFVGESGVRPEIFSLGLRNPWRYSFDRATGDLYIGDVGQGAREEIDVAPAPGRGRGENYGWPIMEGLGCLGGGSCGCAGLTLPVLEYTHGADGGCSVTGGYVYRGTAIPALRGTYFYADFCAGWVRSFRYRDGRAVDHAQWPSLMPGGQIPSFGEDAAGELYVLDSAGGTVYRVVPR